MGMVKVPLQRRRWRGCSGQGFWLRGVYCRGGGLDLLGEVGRGRTAMSGVGWEERVGWGFAVVRVVKMQKNIARGRMVMVYIVDLKSGPAR